MHCGLQSFLCPQRHWFFSLCDPEESSFRVFLLRPRKGLLIDYFQLSWNSYPFQDQTVWNFGHTIFHYQVEPSCSNLLSESKVWETLSPLVLFIFIFTKNVQVLHFNMPLVMTPDGGSPNSVTPAKPSCDTRACATLTRDWKINTYNTYYSSA